MPKYWDTADTPISRIYGGWENKVGKLAEVGLEIEIEGRGQLPTFEKDWTQHADGSLRGVATEYVLDRPRSVEAASKALDIWAKALQASGFRPTWSNRTSVHVHVNVRNLTCKQFFSYVFLYSVFEDLLSEYCGKDRMGNLFCQRFKDSESQIDNLKAVITHQSWPNLTDRNQRYAALNFAALAQFGSLEFRLMRGTDDVALIKEWMGALVGLKHHALEIEDPRRIIEEFSSLGPYGFLRKYLPDSLVTKLTRFDNWNGRLWESLRLIQEVAYVCLWVDPNVEKNKEIALKQTALYEQVITRHRPAGNEIVIYPANRWIFDEVRIEGDGL